MTNVCWRALGRLSGSVHPQAHIEVGETVGVSSVVIGVVVGVSGSSSSSTARRLTRALDVVELSESAVYDINEGEYVRKTEVDEERKDTDRAVSRHRVERFFGA